jgi:hypothetical protein
MSLQEQVAAWVNAKLNSLETLTAEIARLRDENARLIAENSRLRGEPTEPTSILDAMRELRAVSGGAWDRVADPGAYLRCTDGPATGEGGGDE